MAVQRGFGPLDLVCEPPVGVPVGRKRVLRPTCGDAVANQRQFGACWAVWLPPAAVGGTREWCSARTELHQA